MKKIHTLIFIISTLFLTLVIIFRTSFADEGIDILKRIQWVFWENHIVGSFSPTGNAGTITMLSSLNEGTANGSGIYLNTIDNTLTGSFFLQTVGYASIVPDQVVSLTPPAWGTGNIIAPWKITGYVWSDNAGWISLDALNPSYSGVYYLPTSQSFTGYAWSDSLGFLSFNDTNQLDFLGKVKILGNIGWNKSFDILYSLGWKLNTVSYTPFLNDVRKKVALMTRSVPSAKINTSNVYAGAPSVNTVSSDLVYFKLSGADAWKYVTIGSSSNDIFTEKNNRTLIIEWGDLYIDWDIPDSAFAKSRVIIVIKDSLGNGGNIYIHGGVKKIVTSMIAEWSIYSGYPTSAPNILPVVSYLYNDIKSKITNLPSNQLYVYGTVISRNTIGGSAEAETGANGSCPYLEANCDRDTAVKYDLNYFRSYNKDVTRRWYKNDTLDNYSVVIEYDTRILSDAPPGLIF